MKFFYRRCFISNNQLFNSIFKLISVLILLIIDFIQTTKIINFKNSLYLLDFEYYHTTEVSILFVKKKFILKNFNLIKMHFLIL